MDGAVQLLFVAVLLPSLPEHRLRKKPRSGAAQEMKNGTDIRGKKCISECSTQERIAA